AAVSDPNIVEYIAHGVMDDDTPYLAMAWLDGSDLAARLAKGPLSVDEALTTALGAAKGLACAHARKIIHRDVKPSNLFLVGGQYDQVKLLDFGIARVEGADAEHLTTTGLLLGTPAYMAPEQARPGGGVSPRTDVYGLGAVLYHALTGSVPFEGESTL